MSGPIVRNYKGGSIVYFEKDKAEDIFVLQKGRVVLTYTNINGVELKEDVKIGEFFGVKSAIGRYPREETAQVIGAATVLVFKVPEFEKFVSDKTHLIIKMLKVFSSQLRQVHRQVREILGQGEAKNPAFELMNVAEVFYKNGNYEHAVYAFNQYLSHYPDGTYVDRAKQLQDFASKKTPFPLSVPDLVYKPEPGSQTGKLQEMLRTAAVTKDNTPSSIDPNSIQALFDKASTLFNALKYEDAANIYKDLSDRTDTVTQEEEQLVENSLFHYGKVLYKSKDFAASIGIFSSYIKKYPKGMLLKENLYHLALATEANGDRDKANQFFQKVVNIPPLDDSISEDAKKKLKGR
ncbi:cAMP-binding protein [Leptospira ryugenii]|uniref:cAMP-binding protein n=1 Tax=Leptospira ryugenii TaxID=1917863 RepID=A0A2P2DVF7_9LEPT|nr:tetratricopeptide repeat protein [Leptospira ryugenii]GBF48595.1 cAMP-binding protein [Leptospira ryugenii]